MQEFIRAFYLFAEFNGRDTRQQFWMFALVYFIINILLTIIDSIIFGMSNIPILSSIFQLATIVPYIAITARRLHDIGKSGWWQLIGLIPVIGWIILIIWLATDSEPRENRFGYNPKEPQY